jgi:hypothetical protein
VRTLQAAWERDARGWQATVHWNGRGSGGARLPAALYWLRPEAASAPAHKLLLVD